MYIVLTRGRSCVVVCGRSCVVVRDRAGSRVVVRGRAWSCRVVRGRSWSCVVMCCRAPSRPTPDQRYYVKYQSNTKFAPRFQSALRNCPVEYGQCHAMAFSRTIIRGSGYGYGTPRNDHNANLETSAFSGIHP